MLTRRQFGWGALMTGALAAASTGTAYAGSDRLATRTARAAAMRSAYDYTTRETFDHFDRTFHASGTVGQPTDTNEHGALAWGQSYVLAGFIRMYEAYQDTHYLDRLITNIDLVLANRDSVRGVTDYRGRSLPGWRAMHPYTVGIATLKSGDGRPVLEVRSAQTYADLATATVRAGSTEDRFTLEVRNSRNGATATFTDLSADPASPDFAVRRINDAYPTPTLVTAKAVGEAGDTALPAHGATPLVSQPVVFTVHTGMITYPMASFARLVLRSRRLLKVAKYRQKAVEYLAAAKAAAAVHDDEWRQTDDGGGYFVWNKGTPLGYDGTEQPTNQSLALGQTYAEIAAATGERHYADRVRRMARTFARELTVDADDAYTWAYWPTFGHTHRGFSASDGISEYTPSGRGAKQIEDLSHGAIDVEFAALAHRGGLGFRGLDMGRFARSYSKNMATTDPAGVPTTFLRVDGTGGLAAAGQYLQAPRWMMAAPWDRDVFQHAKSIYEARAVEPQYGSYLLCVAYLNWYPRRGA
ncbi:hypothetical protein [Rhizohabitans arisaemae]|uniref:hypothetical protein n=1 Tax=Rhizohabitans arisaemae TaxID=2720610 RepID=UPI0024B0C839|nr:hypothetical protein [Rhizohabitans arisaemae]